MSILITKTLKQHKAHVENVGLVSSDLCTLWLGAFGLIRLRSLLIAVRWRPLIFAVVGNDLRRLFGRPLVLVFALRERSGRSYPQHRYHH